MVSSNLVECSHVLHDCESSIKNISCMCILADSCMSGKA